MQRFRSGKMLMIKGITLPLRGLVIPSGETGSGTAGMRRRRILFCFSGILLMSKLIPLKDYSPALRARDPFRGNR